MKTIRKKEIAKLLDQSVKQSNEWFEDKTQSQAFIIGYLQGVIMQLSNELKTSKKG